MLVTVTVQKPTCWKCGETGNFSSSCLGKKTPGVLALIDQNSSLAESVKSTSPVMGMSATGTGAVTPPVEASIFQKAFAVARGKGNGWASAGPEGSAREQDLSPWKAPKGNSCTAPLPLLVLRAMPWL